MNNDPSSTMIYSVNRFATTTRKTKTWHNNSNETTTLGYVRYDKIIGHLHFAKTAGTTVNGELLAAHYERVCGHKG
jgi:hypothetical protein